MRNVLVAMGMLALVGCGHGSARNNAAAAYQSTKEGFNEAYGGVKTGARAVAHAGGWVLEKVGNGTVRVMYGAHLGRTARWTEDRWITTKLKGEYGLDRDVRASQINVDTKGGVVTLTGVVDNAVAAEAAIRRALDTDGVVAVNSNLAWPTTNQARTYEPGDAVHLRARQ